MYKTVKAIDKITDGMIVVVCILLMLFGGYAMYDNQYVYASANNRSMLLYKPNGEPTEAWDPGELVDDVIGWLTIDDTTIDYPVVQGEDNQEYLNKDPYGNFSLSGSIFLDTRCAGDFSDPYSLLYGHHMAKQLMFGSLDQYLDEAFFRSHRTGTLTTENVVYRVTVFAVLPTDATDGIVFMDEEDFAERLDEHIRQNALYFDEPRSEQILCMSTCTDGGSLGRLAVFAALEPRTENAASLPEVSKSTE